jgi:hypothetical protein
LMDVRHKLPDLIIKKPGISHLIFYISGMTLVHRKA